jgi:hypothetical protein
MGPIDVYLVRCVTTFKMGHHCLLRISLLIIFVSLLLFKFFLFVLVNLRR